MRLVEGNTYATFHAETFGPLERLFDSNIFFHRQGSVLRLWYEDGVSLLDKSLNIVSEVPQSVVDEADVFGEDEDCPVVTRTCIKPGVYGAVAVTQQGVSIPWPMGTFEEILTAANILIQIGEAMERGAKIEISHE